MTLVQIDQPDCGPQSGPLVHYHAHPFTPTISGNYVVSLTSDVNRAAFYVYRNPFSPSSGTLNCIAAANLGNPRRIVVPLAADVAYTIVVFNNISDQTVTIDYTVTIWDPILPQADFSDDGLTDLAVVRNAGGAASWWVSNTASGTVSQVTWGLATDVFLAANFGGDGRADTVIWRPGPLGTAGFWIRTTGLGAIAFRQFGQTGDDARVMGDYDGDTRPDHAIYRPGAAPGLASIWYSRLTLTGQIIGTV
jgi:hypothetical protein